MTFRNNEICYYIPPTHALANHTISVLIHELLKDKTLKIIGTTTCFGFP